MKQGISGPLLIAVAIFMFFALVLPAYDDIRAVQNAVSDRTTMLNDLENALSSVKRLKGQMDERTIDVKKLGSAIAGAKKSDEVLVALENIAGVNGMQILRFAMGEGGEQANFKIASVDLSVKGTYSGFKSFLKDLESNLRLFDVQSINISEGQAGLLNFNLRLNLYYLK